MAKPRRNGRAAAGPPRNAQPSAGGRSGASDFAAGESAEASPSESELVAADAVFARPWAFVRGTPDLAHLPPPQQAEIAFAGRSNVGKSSLINAVVGQHGLARTSNTPGRTQELNFFTTAGLALLLVDMPGYGFARAPKAKVDAWIRLVKTYLRGRSTLKRVYLLIDARHGIKPVDREIMVLLNEAAVSFQVVLTKADKISATALDAALARTGEALRREPAAFPEVLATSSVDRKGISELRASIFSAAQLAPG